MGNHVDNEATIQVGNDIDNNVTMQGRPGGPESPQHSSAISDGGLEEHCRPLLKSKKRFLVLLKSCRAWSRGRLAQKFQLRDRVKQLSQKLNEWKNEYHCLSTEYDALRETLSENTKRVEEERAKAARLARTLSENTERVEEYRTNAACLARKLAEKTKRVKEERTNAPAPQV